MVKIDRVHTGGGDGGETSLVDGSRTKKDSVNIHLVGSLDEINTTIGMVLMETNRLAPHSDGGDSSSIQRVQAVASAALTRVQNELFDLGAELGCRPDSIPDYLSLLSQTHSDVLLQEIEAWSKKTSPLTSFVLPGGAAPVAMLHLARTMTRRLERFLVEVADGEDVKARPEVLQYINRLSDWFFVMGRWMSMMIGEPEPLWLPLGKRPAEKGVIEMLHQISENDADFEAL